MQKIILSLLLLTGSLIIASAQKAKTKTKTTLSDTTKNHWLIRAHGNTGKGEIFNFLTNYDGVLAFDGTGKGKIKGYGLDFGRTFGKNNNFYVMTGIGMQETGWYGKWGYFYTDDSNRDSIQFIPTGRGGTYYTHVVVPVKLGLQAGWFFSEISAIGSYVTKWSSSGEHVTDNGWEEIPLDPDLPLNVKHLNLMAGLTLGVSIPVTKHIRLQLGVDGKISVKNAFKESSDVTVHQDYGIFKGYANAAAFAGIMYQF